MRVRPPASHRATRRSAGATQGGQLSGAKDVCAGGNLETEDKKERQGSIALGDFAESCFYSAVFSETDFGDVGGDFWGDFYPCRHTWSQDSRRQTHFGCLTWMASNWPESLHNMGICGIIPVQDLPIGRWRRPAQVGPLMTPVLGSQRAGLIY